MEFDSDDLGWAYGELLHLFAAAARTWRLPNEVDPDLFHSAWSVLNAQPFEERDKCQKRLMLVWRGQPVFPKRYLSMKRYENALAH